MRAGFVSAALMALVGTGPVGCVADDDISLPALADGMAMPPPPREVRGDGPIGASLVDAEVVPTGPPVTGGNPSDAASDPPAPDPDAPVDGVEEAQCDLLRQDCPAAQNCYPAGGGSRCQLPERLVPAGGSCVAHTDCDRYHVCSTDPAEPTTCQPVCDPQAGCPGARTCVLLSGTNGGYCRP